MGGNMVRRLLEGGHKAIVYDPVPEAVQALVKQGAVGASSVVELTSRLSAPWTVWLMVPSGEITEKTIVELAANLASGDCIVDGGNSYYKDSTRRAVALSEENIYFLDVGTSGGIWGLKKDTA
jgi:6-phosphogluconate dehydrogenase